MPASLITDMNSNSGGLEDQRALQIALELSMLGLSTGEDEGNSNLNSAFEDGPKVRKSANMTECVPVPSSEHVAEIVGRQGCKIKALRAKTNTYIKTPVRGEEPVFVVTGRKEDVHAAKREILSAAEHFSQIRATRRNNSVSSTSSPNGTVVGTTTLAPGPPSPTAPGQVTIQVRVPYRVVGLVVGPKGATIKRIQQTTHTYIVTPSRDKEPVFEVTGLPENVEKAREEIESHIAMRTGGLVDANSVSNPSTPPERHDNDFHINGVDSGFHDLNSDLVGSIYKPPSSNSAFTTYNSNNTVTLNSNNLLSHQRNQDNNIFNFPSVINGSAKIGEFTNLNGFTNGFNYNFYDNDEGIASPTFESSSVIPASPIWPELGDNRNHVTLFGTTGTTSTVSLPRRSSSLNGTTTPRLSPTLTDSSNSSSEHTTVRRIRSDPLSGSLATMTTFAPLPNSSSSSNYYSTSNASISSSTSTSPTDSTGSVRRRSCLLCGDGEVIAALVPCGHNLFCMECANLILEKPESDRRCPVSNCQQTPTQAIRIFS